ncbi:MAG: hypothetical protein NZ899_00820 [Thermoguttaceae bacterium]|nr:hypothetical protein [Thermoguttaceae bacterium]MDW8077436.1 hypothetical protein [Thermoguttaceae bacterium]
MRRILIENARRKAPIETGQRPVPRKPRENRPGRLPHPLR